MEAGLTSSNNLVIDNTFEAQDSGIYQLLVHYDGHQLTYGVVDPGTNVFIVLGSVVNSSSKQSEIFLEELFSRNEILKLEYKHASLTLSGGLSTLVPSAFFEKEKSKELLSFTNDNPINTIGHTSIPKMNATLVYNEEKKLTTAFLKQHPYGKTFHNAAILIQTMLRINRYDQQEKLYIDTRHNSFDLFFFRQGELVLFNQYKYETSNDLLYHVINTMQQLNAEVKTVEVLLSGVITNQDESHTLLSEYIPRLSFNEGLESYEYGLQLQNIYTSKYMSLLNLSVCV